MCDASHLEEAAAIWLGQRRLDPQAEPPPALVACIARSIERVIPELSHLDPLMMPAARQMFFDHAFAALSELEKS